MTPKTFLTPCGPIRYWVSGADLSGPTLVFLPGLTADHRLFERQTAHFEGKYPMMVWDAPGHGQSWPFALTFSLLDKARWVEEILQREALPAPVIVGQSMGGYVGQAYAQLFPQRLRGFVSVDSAPLQRQYVTAAEIWLLKRMEPVYRYWPWRHLMQIGTDGVASTAYGRRLMYEIMDTYTGDQRRYAALAGHGFRILAESFEMDLPWALRCPALLICGTEDHAGSCLRLNRAWHQRTGLPLELLKGAGHNSNTDRPEQVNALIEGLLARVKECES